MSDSQVVETVISMAFDQFLDEWTNGGYHGFDILSDELIRCDLLYLFNDGGRLIRTSWTFFDNLIFSQVNRQGDITRSYFSHIALPELKQ